MTKEKTLATTFESFQLHEGLMLALQEANFTVPSLIQQEAIPHILAKRDLIGQAQTGTGKTGAFGLPALHLLQQNPGSQMLVLVPTRELAKQVSDELYRFSRHLGIRTAIVCGGKSFKTQIESLQNGVQVLVATPGRLLDLLESDRIPTFKPSIVVLDEADEMLDMGFLDDIKSIFDFLPKVRQTLLFSATMPLPIKKLSERILQNPLCISVEKQETVNQDIEQFYFMIREEERDYALVRVIDYENPEKAVIFCRTKKDVDRLTHFLMDAGYQAKGLHGDMEQNQREEVIRNFRSPHLRLLVATDVAARGLSVPNVSHVFNYHLPFDPTNYVHRIGRTGRAGNKGIAGTFLTAREWRDFQRFEKVLGTKIIEREIPTLHEVKMSKRQRLADTILSQSIHEETKSLLQLMHGMDAIEIASKVISLYLSQQVVVGPERMGLERGQFDRTKQQMSHPSHNSRHSRNHTQKPYKRFASTQPFSSKNDGYNQKNRKDARVR